MIAHPLEVGGDRGEIAEVRIDERVGVLAAHPRVAREPEVAQPVDHTEVDHLGDASHVRRDGVGLDRVHLGSGAPVDVLAALECLDELLLAGHVGEHAQLHL